MLGKCFTTELSSPPGIKNKHLKKIQSVLYLYENVFMKDIVPCTMKI